jgi:hypothetical protein
LEDHDEWLRAFMDKRLQNVFRKHKVARDDPDRWQLLLDKYNIARDDPDRWQSLGVRLAMEFVEFICRGKRDAGRPQKYDDVGDFELIKHVETCRGIIAEERGCVVEAVTVIDACRRLKKWRFRPAQYGKTTAASLQKRYIEAWRRLPQNRLVQKILEEQHRPSEN